MFKKTILLALSVGVLIAFAAPAANAAALFNSEGELLVTEPPATVTATSTNVTMVLASGAVVSCEEVTFDDLVTENDGETVRVTSDGTSDTATNCRIGYFEIPYNITPTFEEVYLSPEKNSIAFSWVVHLPNGTECTLRSGASQVSYTSGQNSFHVKAAFANKAGGCEGGTLTGDFTLQEGMVLG